MMTNTEKKGWFKSSYSGGGNGCLEITADMVSTGVVPARDSKLTESPVVDLSTTGFAALVSYAKADQS